MPPTPRPNSTRKRSDSSGGIDRRLLAIGGGAVVVLVAIVLGVVLSGGDNGGTNGEGGARTALESAGCTLKVVAALKGADHSITDPDGTSPTWNTSPPTSGPHYAETLIYGSYKEPIQQARALHNLEHGAVTIQYGAKVPTATVAELESFYNAHTDGTILAPFPKLGDKIALAAWNADNPSDPGRGILGNCSTFDENAFSSFLSSFQFKGPERFPAETMGPGSN
jgi:Protein of unknown function (DUF3105)